VLERLGGVRTERQEVAANKETIGAEPEPDPGGEAAEKNRGLEEALQ
jgi:hypothetical protein